MMDLQDLAACFVGSSMIMIMLLNVVAYELPASPNLP